MTDEAAKLKQCVVDQVRDYAILTINPEGRIVSWNRGGEAIFGYSEADVVGRSAELIFTPEECERGIPEKEMAEAAKMGSAGDNRWHVRKDGSRLWANGVMTALEQDNELIGFVKILRDNTEQKQTNDALHESRAQLEESRDDLEARVAERTAELRQSEQRFATAFHASVLPTVILRLADQRYLDVNQSFLRLTERTRDEVVGHTAEELELYLDTDKRDNILRLFREGKETPATEVRLRRKSGEIRYGILTGAQVTIDEEPCVLGSFVDITDRKRTEQDLMTALQAVMQDTTSLAHSVMEKLTQIKAGGADGAELAELTDRERQVLELVAKGLNNQQIASELGISPQTVRNYVVTVYQKINVHSRAEAVVWARERGMGGF